MPAPSAASAAPPFLFYFLFIEFRVWIRMRVAEFRNFTYLRFRVPENCTTRAASSSTPCRSGNFRGRRTDELMPFRGSRRETNARNSPAFGDRMCQTAFALIYSRRYCIRRRSRTTFALPYHCQPLRSFRSVHSDFRLVLLFSLYSALS